MSALLVGVEGPAVMTLALALAWLLTLEVLEEAERDHRLV